MDKSVLVIDTPKRCEECEVFNPYEGCPLTGSLGEIDDDCPLKRLPKKRNPYEYPDTVSFEKAQYHADGYNQCLKDILGETE